MKKLATKPLEEQIEDLKRLLHSKTHEQSLAEMPTERRVLVERILKRAEKIRMTDKEIQAILDEMRSQR